MSLISKPVMKALFITLALGGGFQPATVQAQTEQEQEQAQQRTAPPPIPEDYERRLILAREVHEFRPMTQQVEDALDFLFRDLPDNERENLKADIITGMNAIELTRLEALSITTMAQIFTPDELQVMIDYYSAPEAESIASKAPQYRQIIDPQISAFIRESLGRMQTGLLWRAPP